MSFMIGINEICNEVYGHYYEIAIYDKLCAKYQFRWISFAESSFEQIILNLKNEFNEKLTKIYVVKKNPVSNITSDDPLVHFLSSENMKFTDYLSAKLSPNTKIMKIDTSGPRGVRCVLYEFIGFRNSISEYKPIKCFETRTDVEDIYGLLIQIFGCNLREIHAIYHHLNDFSLAKFETKYEHFCSFTKCLKFYVHHKAEAAVINGRFLINDKNIQSLVKLQPCYQLSHICVRNFDFKATEHISSYGPVNTYKPQTKLMGIDLGASRIVVCISRNGTTDLLKIDQEYSMPSVISFVEEKPIIGNVAVRQLKQQNKSVLYDLKYMMDTKRDLGIGPWPFGLFTTTEKLSFVVESQGKFEQYSTVEIYRILLEKLKTVASEYQSDLNEGEPVSQAVITVPDFENKMMLADICEAANLVGIKIIDIITEIHAAVLYFLSEYLIPPDQTIAIVDIGGGTGFIQKFSFDQGFGEKHDLSFLCGRNVNQYLWEEIIGLLKGKVKRELLSGIFDKYFGLTKIEEIKETLSFDETVSLNLPNKILEKENPPQLTRTWFEQNVIEGLLFKHWELTAACQDINRFPKPSKVFLVGGTCRIPYIQNYFKSMFGEDKVIVPNNLQDITATGALIHGLQILNCEIDPLFKMKTDEMVLPNKSDQSSSKLRNENHFSGNICEENIVFAPNNFENITTTKEYGLQVLNNPSLKMKTNVQHSENKLDKSLNEDFFSENNSVKVFETKNISQKSDHNEKLLLPPK